MHLRDFHPCNAAALLICILGRKIKNRKFSFRCILYIRDFEVLILIVFIYFFKLELRLGTDELLHMGCWPERLVHLGHLVRMIVASGVRWHRVNAAFCLAIHGEEVVLAPKAIDHQAALVDLPKPAPQEGYDPSHITCSSRRCIVLNPFTPYR